MKESLETADRRRFAGSYAHRERALSHLAFGVSSTPRATQRPAAVAIERGEGAHVVDVAAPTPIETLHDTAKVDKDATLLFTGALLREGVLTLPRGLCYFSSAHDLADIEATEAAIAAAMDSMLRSTTT